MSFLSVDLCASKIADRCALLNESLPGAMQAQDDLLMLLLDRDKAHVRPGDGFADRRGICCVVFAALAAHGRPMLTLAVPLLVFGPMWREAIDRLAREWPCRRGCGRGRGSRRRRAARLGPRYNRCRAHHLWRR